MFERVLDAPMYYGEEEKNKSQMLEQGSTKLIEVLPEPLNLFKI